MAELITIKHYWQQWDDPRLIVAVLHNNDLNQVTWEMRAMGGAPKFAESQTLPDVDYAAFAAQPGLCARSPSRIPTSSAGAWDSALAADRPTRAGRAHRPRHAADPAARHLGAVQGGAQSAVLKGDEDRWGFIKEGVKTKAQELRH